jgi:hypothetical protein
MSDKVIKLDQSFTRYKEKFTSTSKIVECVNNISFHEHNGSMKKKILSSIQVGNEYEVTHQSKTYYALKFKDNSFKVMKRSYFNRVDNTTPNYLSLFGKTFDITDDKLEHVCKLLDIKIPNVNELEEGNTYWTIEGNGIVTQKTIGKMGKDDIGYKTRLVMKNVFLTEYDAKQRVKEIRDEVEEGSYERN